MTDLQCFFIFAALLAAGLGLNRIADALFAIAKNMAVINFRFAEPIMVHVDNSPLKDAGPKVSDEERERAAIERNRRRGAISG